MWYLNIIVEKKKCSSIWKILTLGLKLQIQTDSDSEHHKGKIYYILTFPENSVNWILMK